MPKRCVSAMPRFREHLLSIPPYASARDEFPGQARIYLDANENPHGFHWAGEAARYPDPHHQRLRAALAAYLHTSPDEILCGNGSDEIIDWLIRVACEPHQEAVLVLEPSYGVYETYARLHGAYLQKVRLGPDYELQAETVLCAITPETRLLFLCSPNNPTGNRFSPAQIESILRHYSGWVVLDEAYVEFAGEPDYWLRRRASYENLIILRTFSKAWGMAGWRIGYAVAPQAVVQLFYRTKLPYNLSQPAQLAAEQTLAQAAVIKSYIAQIQSERTRLAQALMTHPLVAKVFPSEANFLLVRFRYATRQLYEALLRQGIVTRFRGNLPLCEETIRISVGTPAENETLIQTLCAISSLIATEPS